MPKLQPRPKERRKVPIPDELRESFHEVFELIQQAKHDPDIRLNYDDAIQMGKVVGGKHGNKLRPYVLTYYPNGIGGRDYWFLTLHRTEVEDIGDGIMREISMYCCTSPDCECKFREQDKTCPYCDYVDEQQF
jgi:hypothetical protein